LAAEILRSRQSRQPKTHRDSHRDLSLSVKILQGIDFEKAFLTRALHKFSFGPSFIQWVRVLYKHSFSCLLNNGFTTGPFSLGRGVRQGDPLSPYLFILVLETLAIRIREDSSIQGLKIGDEVVKLSLFADDMTCILKDKISYLKSFLYS